MTAFEYADQDGSAILPAQVEGWYLESGINREALEIAMRNAGVRSYQASMILHFYCDAREFGVDSKSLPLSLKGPLSL